MRAQVKIFAADGVVFPAEGHVGMNYSEPELAAIVEEAQACGTYAMAHVYTDDAIPATPSKSVMAFLVAGVWRST
jgi:imidazolonepropionase-like amidohydrolase